MSGFGMATGDDIDEAKAHTRRKVAELEGKLEATNCQNDYSSNSMSSRVLWQL